MKPPIFVIEGWDVTTYQSVETAVRWLEAPDVRDGLFEVYDSEGLRLTARAEADRASVELVTEAEAPMAPGELATVLRHFLEAVPMEKLGIDTARIEAMTLPELVELMVGLEHRGEPPGLLRRLNRLLRRA